MPDAAATAPLDAEAAPPRSRAKLLLLLTLAVLLLGGAAAFFLLRPHAPKAAEAKKEEHRAPAQYIVLDPPFVVNFDGGSAVRFLQVAVQLMTRDLETADFLKTHDPAIRNDLLLLLGNQKVEEVATREGKEKLREDALQTVRRIVTEEGGHADKVEAVYFTSFVMQ